MTILTTTEATSLLALPIAERAGSIEAVRAEIEAHPDDAAASTLLALLTTGPRPEITRLYGEGAIASTVGRFTLVHLDRPSAEQIAERVLGFDPGKYFFDDCPLCEIARRDGGHIVFDAQEV